MFSSPEEILEFIKRYKDYELETEKDIYRLVWLAKGGITLDDAWGMSSMQRFEAYKIFVDLLRKSHGDTTEYL